MAPKFKAPNPYGKDWDLLHHYHHPGNVKIRLTLFWATSVNTDNAPALVDQAEYLLQQHNLSLDVKPGKQKSNEFTLEFNRALEYDEDVLVLRKQAHEKFKDDGIKKRLPVIFCPFSFAMQKKDDNDPYGIAIRGTDWLPFVLINSARLNPDKVTLLHEIGHAAKLEHETFSTQDPVINFMSYGSSRNGMLRRQLLAIATAYFAG